MAKYKIATPAGASFTVAGGGYDDEMKDLRHIDCEIVEGPTDEDGFIAFAQDADDPAGPYHGGAFHLQAG